MQLLTVRMRNLILAVVCLFACFAMLSFLSMSNSAVLNVLCYLWTPEFCMQISPYQENDLSSMWQTLVVRHTSVRHTCIVDFCDDEVLCYHSVCIDSFKLCVVTMTQKSWLFAGAVSSAILKAGGFSIQQECTKLGKLYLAIVCFTLLFCFYILLTVHKFWVIFFVAKSISAMTLPWKCCQYCCFWAV